MFLKRLAFEFRLIPINDETAPVAGKRGSSERHEAMKHINGFSPEAIAEICNGAKNIADRHRKYSEAIGSEIELIDRLLAHHLAGVPDAQIELVAVGRRLTSLIETGGPRNV